MPLPDGGAGDWQIAKAYTAAHEGTANDKGRVFAGGDLGMLTFADDPAIGEPRWSVYSSANKHATYGSIAICEGVSFLPCFDEDCAPYGVEPGPYTLLFDYVNAGEESAPMVSDLAVIGCAGEDAWADQKFCGGLGGTGCSSAVREKLLVNPF